MSTSSPKKRRKFLRVILSIIFLIVIVVVVAIQPFFIKAVIIPQVAKATDSQIEVQDLSLSLFKQITATGVVYKKNDQSLEVQLDSADIHYDLIKMIKGQIWVDHLTLTAPQILVAPSTASAPKSQDSPSQSSSADAPQLHIQNIKIIKGSFAMVMGENRLNLSNINLDLPELINGRPLQTTLTAEVIGRSLAQPDQILMSGNVTTEMRILLSEKLMPTSVFANLEAEVGENEAGVPPLRLKADLDMNLDLDQSTLSLAVLNLTASQHQTSILEVALSKPTQMNWGQNPPTFSDSELKITLPPVELHELPFSELLPIASGRIHLNSLLSVADSGHAIEGELKAGVRDLKLTPNADQAGLQVSQADLAGRVSWQKGDVLKMSSTISGQQIQLPDGRNLPTPLELQFSGNIQASQASLDNISVSWSENPSEVNRLYANGAINWQDRNALQLDFSLKGNKLDLDPWATFIEVAQKASPDQMGATESTAPTKEVDPLQNSSPIEFPTLPLQHANIDLAITHVHFKQITLEDLAFNLHADKNSLKISPLGVSINGSRFSTDLDAGWVDGPLQMNLKSNLTPLDIAPIMDSLMPEKKGAITGILQADTQFKIQGNSLQSLWDSFKGNIDLSYSQGKVRLIDSDPDQHSALLHTRKLVQSLVTALADVLAVSPEQLMAPEIEAITFNSAIADNQLTLQEAKVQNAEFLLEVSGDISLNPVIGNSVINNLPVVLGVNTNMAKRIKIYREERLRDDYVVLPSFIKVEGSLATPKIDVRKSVITGLILSGVTERNEIGNKNVQAGLDILGTLLTGEAPPQRSPNKQDPAVEVAPSPTPDTPSPTPEPKSKKEERTDLILEGLQLFQQMRATPTPQPEAP